MVQVPAPIVLSRVLAAAKSTPVEDPYYPDTSNPEVDALHYDLTLDWDGSALTGDATVVFRATQATDQIQLDLSEALTPTTVTIGGRSVNFNHPGDALRIRTGLLRVGAAYRLRIAYSGTPRAAPAPSRRSDMRTGVGWSRDRGGDVYSFQEPYGAFTWFPVNDHPSDKALYDAHITTHDGDVAIFSGGLVGSDSSGDTTTTSWHVDRPAASYLIALAIGPYRSHVATTPGGMEITYWIRPADRRLLPRLVRQGSSAFDWLVDHAGRYPFTTLGVVVVGGASAMETQTMITMSRSAVVRSDAVLAHEMAHQWFGDSVTPTDWRGLWLNEGWAMYLQQWYERDSGRRIYGGNFAHWTRYDEDSRRTSGPPAAYDPATFGDLNVYLGPALMLNTLRLRIGDRRFETLVRAWPAQHAYSNVDRSEFTRWVSDRVGFDVRPLFHRWLDSAHTPTRYRR